MSKELIERLRVFAGDPVLGGVIEEAAERIEELERERDTFYMDYRMKCDEQTKSLCVERDAMQADNARLRESTELLLIARQIGHYRDEWDMLKEALATTPEQSHAAYRNKVIEAFVNEFSRHVGGDGEFWLHEIQNFAMKEQP